MSNQVATVAIVNLVGQSIVVVETIKYLK